MSHKNILWRISFESYRIFLTSYVGLWCEAGSQELCTNDSKTRDEFIDSILEGLLSADNETLKKVIRTWLVLVSKLKGSEVSTIFSSFISRYENDPSMYVSNYSAVLLEEYQSLNDDLRIILRDHLVEAALNQYRGRQIMLALPEKVRSALGL